MAELVYALVLGTSAANKVRVSSCPPNNYESTSTVKKRFKTTLSIIVDKAEIKKKLDDGC